MTTRIVWSEIDDPHSWALPGATKGNDMRNYYGYRAAAALALFGDLFAPKPYQRIKGAPRQLGKTSVKRQFLHGTWVYPHSSDRQRARYARQIAAGKLKMAGVA
jgi:hypothetical protein